MAKLMLALLMVVINASAVHDQDMDAVEVRALIIILIYNSSHSSIQNFL